jgi:thymidine kinase
VAGAELGLVSAAKNENAIENLLIKSISGRFPPPGDGRMITGVMEIDGHTFSVDALRPFAAYPTTKITVFPDRTIGNIQSAPTPESESGSPSPTPEQLTPCTNLLSLDAPKALENVLNANDTVTRTPTIPSRAANGEFPSKAEKTRLELILGPMGSGKSTELSRRLQRKKLYKAVFAISTISDTRYGDQGIITHDGLVTPCVRVRNLDDILHNEQYQKAEVVGIDEANFFPDLPEFIRGQLEMTSKTFIVSGLDGDRNKKPFGRILELIPDADRKDFLTALCKRCADGTEAPFTIELVAFDGQFKVGGTDDYEAVCRNHYNYIRYCQQVDQLKRSHPELHIDKLTVLNH